MKPYETRLSRSAVAGLSDDEYLWALMEPAWDDEGAGTSGQQALARVTYFLRDASNGGLSQALWNRDAGEVAQLIADFELLGVPDQAAMVAEAERTLFFNAPSPAALDKRREHLDALDRDWREESLELLDQRLADEEDLWPVFRQYVDAHPAEFFRD